MSTTIEMLLVVQDRDRKIAELTREQKDIPTRKKQIESRAVAHQEGIKGSQDDLKKQSAVIKEIEVEIESRKQKIAKFREQQYQIKNNTEYRALESEIQNVQKEIRAQEDRELEVMEKMESLRGVILGREKDLKQEQGRMTEDQGVMNKRLENIELELNSLKTDRAELVKDIDKTWLARYDRVFRKNGDYALVPVDNGACGGCHMNLPPQIIHEAKKGMTLTTCNFCSRILYWRP